MTKQFFIWLVYLIDSGDVHPFYVTPEWRRLSTDVLREDRHECQICKAKGRFRPAVMVHHVNHVKRRPDLALDMYYIDSDGNTQRNLISVCKTCHETVCHPERLVKKQRKAQGFDNQERWD